jgi:hypothetical protein
MAVDNVGVKYGAVVRVKSLSEELVALSPRDAIVVKNGFAEGLETVKVASHIFVFHKVFC